MTHAEAVQRLEDIDRVRLKLFRLDKTSWTVAQWEKLTERKAHLARLEQEAQFCIDVTQRLLSVTTPFWHLAL
jgi:hypothetical protein